MNLDWRSKVKSYGATASPAKQGGTPKRSKPVVVGKTKPDGDFMVGRGGGSGACGLSTYTQRRVGHKGK